MLPQILVSSGEGTRTYSQNDSAASLELEGEDEPVRLVSSMPESRPSGLVAIRFFNNPTSPSIRSPSIGTGGTVNTPKLPPSSYPSTFTNPHIMPNPHVYLPMMPMPFVQRRSADDIPSGMGPVKQLAGVKRGRGRPRTRSTDLNDGMPPAHMMTVLKPALLMPKPPMIPPPGPPGFLSAHLGKLPKLAPRPNMAGPVAMIQPNTIQQARSLMRSSVGAGLPSPALPTKSLPVLPGNLRSFSADAQTPEMAVLRLISDACDIRESSRSSADPLPKPAKEKPKKPRSSNASARKLAPRLDTIKALQPPVPHQVIKRPPPPSDPNQIRKILPRPPSNKLPLPVAPRHRQP